MDRLKNTVKNITRLLDSLELLLPLLTADPDSAMSTASPTRKSSKQKGRASQHSAMYDIAINKQSEASKEKGKSPIPTRTIAMEKSGYRPLSADVIDFPEPKETGKTVELFLSLVSACEQTLPLMSSLSSALEEVFLSYLLWAHTLKSENAFATFRDLPTQINEERGPNIVKVQYRVLGHISWTLC